MKTPYIKPTRYKHDSGFRCFEVGYCELGKKNYAINIQVLGQCSDHIWLNSILSQNPDINLDLTTNGYIRIFGIEPAKRELMWEEDVALSTMRLRGINDQT